MEKANINVLIVDDDPSQGKALLEAIKRQGYNAEWTDSAQQSLTLAHHLNFHLVIVDCMLPRMNGVDLVKELKPHLAEGADIFLITGVFKDRNYMKEAIEKTGARHFLIKPFPLEQILSFAEKSLSKWSGPAEDPMLELYQDKVSDPKSWIEQNPSFHGLHLPILLLRLQQAKVTGQLVLSSTSSITFHQGDICEARTADKQSFFGLLAVELGYISTEDLEAALAQTGAVPIGQRLVDSASLSPHAVTLILQEQILIRLSQMVQNETLELSWLEQIPSHIVTHISQERLKSQVLEWLPSKYDEEWLKSLLNHWGSYSLVWNKSINANLSQQVDAVYDKGSETTPHELFEALLMNEVRLGDKVAPVVNFEAMKGKLERALESFAKANLFQILGLSDKARSQEVQRAFNVLSRAFMVDEKDPACPEDVLQLHKKLINLLNNAYKILHDDGSRADYLKELDVKRSQEQLDLEPSYRAAILELQSGHYANAFKKFDNLVVKKVSFRDLKSFRLWAALRAKMKLTYEVEFDHIPPEQRFSATYMMAKGLLYKSRSQGPKAIECFRKASMLDPKMREPKQEIEKIERRMARNSGTFTRALDSIFGKKKKAG